MTVPSIALIDTDVFSAVYISPDLARKRGNIPVDEWIEKLRGMRVLISFQTRAEVMAGFRASNWGERRLAEAQAKLDSAQTIGVDEQVIDAYARLSAACKAAGHPLQQKVHCGDRWVAAAAIAKGLPLLAGDLIYDGAPGLALLR